MIRMIQFLLICLLPINSFAEKIICDAPEGTRIDYFSTNNINLKNDTFLMGRDKMPVQPAITITNHTVVFSLGAAAEMKASMKILQETEDQISFIGVINGAPILATFYPKLKVLIYSQQSIWPGPEYKGARALILYAKCRDER